MNDYLWTTDRLFYKHEVSEDLPCDTYSAHTHNAYELINCNQITEDCRFLGPCLVGRRSKEPLQVFF